MSSMKKIFFLLIFVTLPQLSLGSTSLTEKHFWPVLNRAIDQSSLSLLGAGALATLLTAPNDRHLQKRWMNYQQMDSSTAKLTDDIAQYGLGPVIALTQYYFDQENGEAHIRALVYVTAIGSTLKFVTQRERPNAANKHSFPSGHTYSAFATATSLTYAYGWKAGVLAFPVAAAIGLGRIADNYHWASDVVAGAFLGYWIGRATFYSPKKSDATAFLPYFSNGNAGILYSIEI